jgi:hypothetical protein
MSIPQSVGEILDHHVTFELECIDRMYLNVYVPRLQCESGVANFFRMHRGHKFASSALMDPMTKTFVAAIERFAKQQQIPIVQFQKGQRRSPTLGFGPPCSLPEHTPASIAPGSPRCCPNCPTHRLTNQR